jgi:hypothetical protein
MEDIRDMKQNDIAFLGLGVKFPALINAPGVSPWNPNQLDIWAAEAAGDQQCCPCRSLPAQPLDAGARMAVWALRHERRYSERGIEPTGEHSSTGRLAKPTWPDCPALERHLH